MIGKSDTPALKIQPGTWQNLVPDWILTPQVRFPYPLEVMMDSYILFVCPHSVIQYFWSSWCSSRALICLCLGFVVLSIYLTTLFPDNDPKLLNNAKCPNFLQ